MHSSSDCVLHIRVRMSLVLCSGLFLQEATYMVNHGEKVRDHVMDARYVIIFKKFVLSLAWTWIEALISL